MITLFRRLKRSFSTREAISAYRSPLELCMIHEVIKARVDQLFVQARLARRLFASPRLCLLEFVTCAG